MSFDIHCLGELLIEGFASIVEAELVAYGIGRENGIEHVTIWYVPDRAVDSTDQAVERFPKAHAKEET